MCGYRLNLRGLLGLVVKSKMVNSSEEPHLLGHEAELFSRQILKGEDEPPVKVTVSVQRPVVDIRLLLVVLHAWHPAGTGNNRSFYLSTATVTFYYSFTSKVTNI